LIENKKSYLLVRSFLERWVLRFRTKIYAFLAVFLPWPRPLSSSAPLIITPASPSLDYARLKILLTILPVMPYNLFEPSYVNSSFLEINFFKRRFYDGSLL
jgi:hypothetical protein